MEALAADGPRRGPVPAAAWMSRGPQLKGSALGG